jgi:hypothetical protein
MSTTLRFRNHGTFHRAAWQMAGAGALAGLLAFLVFGGAPPASALIIVASAAVLGALAPAQRARGAALAARGGLMAVAALALVLLPRAGEPTAAVAGFAGCFGLALALDARGWRLAIAVGLGALTALLARHAFTSIAASQELASLPGWLVATGAGAAFAFISVIALLPHHLALHRDVIAERYLAMEGSVGGEVRELIDRGYGIWRKAATRLAEGDDNRQTLAEGVQRLFDVAQRWQSIGAERAQGDADALAERIAALDARIEATGDEVARGQYQKARAALVEQLRYLGDIGTSRERVLARMHSYVALMEQLHLAVVNAQSSDASRAAAEIEPLARDLEALGADIDSCADALVDADASASA